MSKNALQQKQREKGRHHSEKEGTHKHNDEANNRALAPKLGPGDAKPLAPRTPEATRSREDACSGSRQVTHRSEEAEEAAFRNPRDSSGSRELTHRSEEAEEAAFRNHRDCSGSRELTGNNKGRDPGEHEHTSNNLEATETPGGGQVPAMTQQPAPPPYAWGASRSHSPRTMPSICIPPRAPGGCGGCGGCGGGGGADEILRRCLCRYQLKSRSYSTGDLDDQQLLAIEGSKKVAARRALDVQVDGVRKRPVKRAKNHATAIK